MMLRISELCVDKGTHPICSKVNDERYSLSRQLYIVLVGVRWADKQNQCD